ncbi:HAMP domain-containing histidine kinase [Spiractinospora alimapuensis]|uniref:sensor histidine kinase n=1 Tax=Spiractinospora alimapuensis TaxID=2820884 RepID=UPI001F39DCE9|nr:HAMP domain-containing sensor histidine kinase [Spiractinospora alimapuensis]QVQ50755.1 HAMP domain-containing histidine kinase [Spiractinospora alimapuensis]
MTVSAPPREGRMSLRARLVVILTVLLAVGVAVPTGAMFGALQDWASDTRHDVLRVTGQGIAADLAADPSEEPGLPAEPFPGHADRVEVPSFFQLRDARGAVLSTSSPASGPELAATLPDGLLPDTTGAEEFTRVPGTDGGDAEWLVRVSRLADGDLLVVGMRDAATERMLGRVGRIALICSFLAIALVVALAWPTVGRALRPLNRVAATADAIGGGDLSERVPVSGQRTEVGRLGAAFNAMVEQVQRAFAERDASDRRLRRFVSDASHELRTPIATVRGYAELFRRGAAERPADLEKAMARIESEARRMGSLVEEMLLLARLDEREAPLALERLDLVPLAEEAVTDAAAADPERVFTIRAEGPAWVDGDADRLRRLLGNLLSNVSRHTPPGTSATVRIHTGDEIVVDVSDDGPGLPETDRTRVFERFYRSGGQRSSTNSGAGLGLAIVEALATAHHGSVHATHSATGGASFRVTLPPSPPTAPSAL